MRYIELTEEEREQVQFIYDTTTNKVTRLRAYLLILSNIEAFPLGRLAREGGVNRTTVYHLFNAWESAIKEHKMGVLTINKGRGSKA